MNQFDRTSAARLARQLIRTAMDAALGTLDAAGYPHASHVACAADVDGAPLLLVSDLALHTQNLKRDRRASLLFVAREGETADTNTRARITLVGDVAAADDRAAARDRFLRRHPGAAMYADFADFSFLRFQPLASHLVAGFGRIIDLAPDDILADAAAATALRGMDRDACEHMNEDHADALAIMATALAGAHPAAWRAIGVDPQGVDLSDGAIVVRAEFDNLVTNGGALRVNLKTLTDRGGEKGSAK